MQHHIVAISSDLGTHDSWRSHCYFPTLLLGRYWDSLSTPTRNASPKRLRNIDLQIYIIPQTEHLWATKMLLGHLSTTHWSLMDLCFTCWYFCEAEWTSLLSPWAFCSQTSWDSVICIWRLCHQFCHRVQCGMASGNDCTWGLSNYAYKVCSFQVLQHPLYPTTKARIWLGMRSLVFVSVIVVKCGNKNGINGIHDWTHYKWWSRFLSLEYDSDKWLPLYLGVWFLFCLSLDVPSTLKVDPPTCIFDHFKGPVDTIRRPNVAIDRCWVYLLLKFWYLWIMII